MENCSAEEMSARLQALRSQNQDVKVLVNGDEAADFGLVVKILDTVKRGGINKVTVHMSVESSVQVPIRFELEQE